MGIGAIAEEVRMRQKVAFADRHAEAQTLDGGGQYSYRREGELQLFNPEKIHKLQHACRLGSYEVFKEFSKLIDDQSRRLCTLRGLMELKSERKPIPIDEVEPVDEIVKRFKTGAMSYGSISKEAHETLAVAMNTLVGARPPRPARWRAAGSLH